MKYILKLFVIIIIFTSSLLYNTALTVSSCYPWYWVVAATTFGPSYKALSAAMCVAAMLSVNSAQYLVTKWPYKQVDSLL